MWRHNKVFEIFPEAAKICCEIASKALNNITNRVIHFVKEGNILKLSDRNKNETFFFMKNFDWAHQRKLEKYEDLQEQCVRNGWITNIFPIEVGC